METTKTPRRRGRGRPTRDEAETINERLLDKAYATFCAIGFAAASIEGIAAASGVGKNTIYRRFPDKQTLFKAVIERQIREFDSQVARLTSDATDALAAVRLAARQISLLIRQPQSLQIARLLISEQRRFPDLAILLDQWLAAGSSRLDALMEKAMRQGKLARRDVVALREALIMMVAEPSLDQLILPDRPTEMSDAAFERRWELFLHGAAA